MEIVYGETNGHVTDESMTSRNSERWSRDRNTFKVKYLENSWKCYLAAIAR